VVSDSISAARTLGSSGSGSKGMMFAPHSPKRLLEVEITAGFRGSATLLSTVSSASTHSSFASRIASTRPTRTPRSVTGAPTPSPPTVRNRARAVICLRLRSVPLSQSAPATTSASASSTARPTANSLERFMPGTSVRPRATPRRAGPR